MQNKYFYILLNIERQKGETIYDMAYSLLQKKKITHSPRCIHNSAHNFSTMDDVRDLCSGTLH